jgi:ribosomal protein S18 acetylase RimI-like enzyme
MLRIDGFQTTQARDDPPMSQTAAFRIRRATLADLDDLVDLECASFSTDRLSRRQYRRHLASISAEVIVAAAGANLLGAAVVFLRRGSQVARLYSIAVAAGARGGGVGATLLRAAEAAAGRRGATRLRLEVRADNAGAARLYERHGYERFGTHRCYYEDGADALRYERGLAGPPRRPMG